MSSQLPEDNKAALISGQQPKKRHPHMILMIITVAVVTVLITSGLILYSRQLSSSPTMAASDIYGFNATDIDGNDVSMDKYRGKVVLVVNVASK
jgi:cytochrome oxidase Cu insertion factor (SCO1/SenC/PrrC family)